MTGTLDYYLLVQLMASGDRRPDRDTLIAILRSALGNLSAEDYALLQADIRALLGAI